jgi:hypothetical protein
MKTKLFSFFIAVVLFSFSGNAQKSGRTAAAPVYPVITLIGSGNGGWTDTAETTMLTGDGITYTLVDKILTDGEVKFREGKCWTGGCPATVTNVYGWGPTDAQFPVDGGWPSGTNAAPVDGGKNIQSKAGSWTITFNRIAGTWSFVAGKPIPVIKLVGTAVTTPASAFLTTADGITFTAKKVALKPGMLQISQDGVLVGGTTFPEGDASIGTDMMTVTTTGIDYDVTYDYVLGHYKFTVATFPIVDIIGNGTTGNEAGWGTPIDMATTDGVTYTLKNLKLYPTSSDSTPTPNGAAGVKFRLNHSWDTNWGGTAFPTGPTAGNNDNIMVAAGTYNVTFNLTTHAYAFSFPIVDIIGNGLTGNESGWSAGINMATIDGVNYTITRTLFATSSDSTPTPNGAAGVKFRLNNSWDTNWGGTAFPVGPTLGDNNDIKVNAGTYAIKFNRETGAYDFGSNLSVKNFSAGSFRAYPNPTRGSWNITSNDDITSVVVYDVLGKAVYTKFGAAKEVSVNATELSKGVYFAKVSSANGTSTLKLIKE